MGKRKDKRKAKRRQAKEELKAFSAFLVAMAARHAARIVMIDTLVAHKVSEKAKASEPAS